MRRLTAMTLTELLTVILIIGLLMGLLLPGVMMLRRSQRKNQTLALLQQLTQAATHYLDRYTVMGDLANGDDFRDHQWRYLGLRPLREGGAPYLEVPLKRLAKGTLAAPVPATSYQDAEHILDAWGSPLVWTIEHGTRAGRSFAKSVSLTSRAGTPATARDDLVFVYTSATATWTHQQ